MVEEIAVVLIPAMLGVLLVRMLLRPVALVWKLGVHCACGFGCLWLLNSISGFTGIFFPVNAVTVLAAGTLGLPGIGLLALLAVMG